MQASVAAFHVTHTTGGILSHAASSSNAPPQDETEDLLSPWLVRSPPEVTTKALAPNFLTLTYTQPALLAAEPKRVSFLYGIAPDLMDSDSNAVLSCTSSYIPLWLPRYLQSLRSWPSHGVCGPSQNICLLLQLDLAVAQIDMVYSQHAFIRLIAFLNKAYPPPSLDPIMVRTSVTLNEIVRERLVGPKRPHQLQAHQQSQPLIQVRQNLL